MDHFNHHNQPRWLALLLLGLACLQAFVLAAEYNNPSSGSKGAKAGIDNLQFERARQVQKPYQAVSSHSERDGSTPEIHEEGQGRGAVVATVAPDLMGYVAGGMDNRGLRKRSMEGGLSSYGGDGVIGDMVASRDINDWEVEDMVLLATVDGALHARSRQTGQALWDLHSETPVVQTIDHRDLAGLKKAGRGSTDGDDLVWIVEPVQDGGLYFFSPMNGLNNVGLSVKKLVDNAPFNPPDSDRVFNGEKKTVTYALDTANGNVANVYSTGGSAMVMDVNCKANDLDPLEDDHVQAHGGYRKKSKTILVGRTEYTVTIQDKRTSELLWTIKYAEWGPNNGDQDLAKQHATSLDNRYILSLTDGTFMGFEQHGDGDIHRSRSKAYYKAKFTTPVVRVFDVVRSMDKESELADYLILPQPKPPMDIAQAEAQSHKTFVNSTPDKNGWFAMTGVNFPFSAAPAKMAKWYNMKERWNPNLLRENKSLIIGLHDTVGFAPHIHDHQGSKRPTIDAGDENNTRHVPSRRNSNAVGQKEGEPPSESLYPGNYEPALLGRSRVLNLAKYNLIDLLVVLPILGIVAYMYLSQRKLMQRVLDNERVNRNIPTTINTINIQDGRIVQNHQPMVIPKMHLDVDSTGRPRLESPVPSPIVPDSVIAERREEEEREKAEKKRIVRRSDEPESDGLPVGIPPPPAIVVDKPLPSPPAEEPEVSTPQPRAETQPIVFQTEEDLPSTPASTPKLEKIETEIAEEIRNVVKEEGETTPTIDQPEIKPGKVRFGDLEFSSHKQSASPQPEFKKLSEDGSTQPSDPESVPKRKKTHRGQRGGARKKKKDPALDKNQQQPQNGVVGAADTIAEAKNIATLPINVNALRDVAQEGVRVEDGTLLIGNLRVFPNEVIGKLLCLQVI
ncbi:hypothetical protein BJ508DRAFT_109917 [Ascobolus immersus RN42]|uniref:Uncharacterized protein n=1 Tax=Ascobolus immersus RN42 TaxID=1160509 RepID=A0A3N4I8C0_ASCIM|nr:hypothetical protein BJ508DRAFT_109917 [Ascobolus immersus RN42]